MTYQESYFLYADNYLFATKQFSDFIINSEVEHNISLTDKDYNITLASQTTLLIGIVFFLIIGLLLLYFLLLDVRKVFFRMSGLIDFNHVVPLIFLLIGVLIFMGTAIALAWSFYLGFTYPKNMRDKIKILATKGTIVQGKVVSIKNSKRDQLRITYQFKFGDSEELISGNYTLSESKSHSRKLHPEDMIYILQYGKGIHILL